ncbi:hypothetical protein F5Y10DRAFT_53613 [Nemania abortiva]|nr:hypothetical protein F5Y10DRAFT_53613 [Nemania abortiva]
MDAETSELSANLVFPEEEVIKYVIDEIQNGQPLEECLGSTPRRLWPVILERIHEDLSGFNEQSRAIARAHGGDALWLKHHIQTADWKYGNSDWQELGAMLEHPMERDRRPGFSLGRFGDFELAVRINNSAIYPLETLSSFMGTGLGVDTINSTAVLSMQYSCNKTRERHMMLIAQLGNIFSTADVSLPLDQKQWSDTQYVLALEVDDNGKAASFVVIYNTTYHNEMDGSGEKNSMERLSECPKFCNGQSRFTVATVPGRDFDTLKPEWGSQEPAGLELQVLSVTTADFVETGIKSSTWAEGALPIGLYQRAESSTAESQHDI